jgi:hypothetical protein
METFDSKLGTNKGLERSRVWIEGKRVASAGFLAKETRYNMVWSGDDLNLIADDNGSRRVSGKGDHPIIDITGKQIAEFFGKRGTHVFVEYHDGLIVIRPGDFEPCVNHTDTGRGVCADCGIAL